MSFLAHAGRPRATPQTQRADEREVQNAAGGFVFPIDGWARLDRFLILGTAGGTFYVGQDQLTEENAKVVAACVREDGPRVVARVVEISEAGRAPKQDYGVFALALATASHDGATRAAAYVAIEKVCRTASTLFQFLSYLRGRRGWSRGLRTAIADWYSAHHVDGLAYQMVKYPQRHGYAHRDLLRLSHANPIEAESYMYDGDRERGRKEIADAKAARDALYRWAVGKEIAPAALPTIVQNAIAAQKLEASSAEVGISGEAKADLAKRLPREALPTAWLKDAAVWEALLYGEDGRGMPLTALIRNLGNLSKIGVLAAGSPASEYVARALTDLPRILASRVHPIAFWLAKAAYGSGHGVRGSGEWAPVGAVEDALMRAFELAFANVEPIGKRVVVAIDTSGSMRGSVAGLPLSAAEIATVMAYVTVKTEPKVQLLSFDTRVQEVLVAGDTTLERFVSRFPNLGGGTDCSLPFIWASQHGADADAVLTFTDNETWAGDMHVMEALGLLRRSAGKPVKAITAAVTATGHDVVDPADPLALGISGFDASVPTIVADFIRG